MTAGPFAPDAALRRRQVKEKLAQALLFAASSLSVLILAVLLGRLLWDGLPAVDWGFLTDKYSPLALLTGTTGIGDAIVASAVILVFTMLFAVPLGVAGAIYLNEYATRGRLTRMIEATIANLAGVPSVVYGLLGLAIFVRFLQIGANMLAAALTLGVLILPIIIVSSQEALKAVPNQLREASFGLGATKWQTVRHHVLPYALPGILTGNILALSRAAGETAPLLVIGLPVYTTMVGVGPLDPGTPLQTRIFFLANDPRATAQELAAGAVVVLLAVTLLLNLAAIVLRHRLSDRIKW